MIVALTVTKFKNYAIPFAFLGMAILRLPLWLNKKCSFWKLLGCGKDAQVDLPPDFKHWAILTCWENQSYCDNFYKNSFTIKWFRFFGFEEFTILLKPLSAHGLWNGKQPFIFEKSDKLKSERVAAITRAAVRIKKVREFRNNIKRSAESMRNADGFVMAIGIGENPFLEQATFSIWRDLESMKNYAYKSFDHSDVIKLTRERKWYSEELFARFEIILQQGSLNGTPINDLKIK